MYNVDGKYSLNLYPQFGTSIPIMDADGELNLISKANAKKFAKDIIANIDLITN